MPNHPLSTTWVDGDTRITAAYMQIINDVVMNLMQGKTTSAELLAAIGASATTHTHELLLTAGERAKLEGIEEGADANPPQVTTGERAVGTSIELRLFTPDDIRNMILTHAEGGASVSSVHGRTGDVVAVSGDYDADEITDTVNKVIMTIAERSKLAGIAAGAQVNATHVSAEEIAAGTEEAARSFGPADIVAMIDAFAGAITSVHGRTGAVVGANGDYTAAQITETSTAKIMTGDERTKLSGIAAGAQVNVALASQAEAEAGTENTKTMTALRAAQAIAAQVPDASSGTKGRVQLAGGIGGSAAAPWPVGLRVSGPTDLTLGAVSDGQFLQRSGSSLVGASGTGTFDISALTVEPLVDNAADHFPFRDTSATANRKVLGRTVGAPLVLGDPYDDRLIKIAAKGQDISTQLRAAIAATASGQYTTIKLIGMGVGSRDASNAWLFQLPASKRIAIIGEGPHGFHLQHAYTSDTAAYTFFAQSAGNGGVIQMENLVLEGIWTRQSSKQEVAGARFTNLLQYREVRLYGMRGIDGVEMGFTAQECGIIDVDRCHIERNTRDCFNFNGRRVSIRSSKAFYSRDDCFAIYVPSSVSNDENWLNFGSILDCEASWTNGIKAAAPRLTISRNHLDVPFIYGIRVFADEGGEGELIPRELSISDNLITNCLANNQVSEASVINRAITIDSYSRAASKIVIRGNRMASTYGALWNGTNYQTPSVLTRGLAAADDASGMYHKSGFANVWEAPTTASREPAHQRIVALSVSSQSAPGYGDIQIRDNTARDMRQQETWQHVWVLYNNASGVNWAVPAAQAAWAGFTVTKANLAGPGSDIWLQKARIELSIGATTSADSIIKVQFGPTDSGAWTDLCSVTLTSGTSTTIYGNFANLPVEAIAAPVWFRVTGEDGDGVTNVAVTRVALVFARDGDTCFDADASQRAGAITSVHGRTGAVVGANGDYTAAQITETSAAKIMTGDERTKLAGIEDGATAAGETGDTFAEDHPAGGHSADAISDGTTKVMMTLDERAALASLPTTVSDAINAAGAVKSAANSASVIGAVSVRDAALHRADPTIPSVTTVLHEIDPYFMVQHVEVDLPAASANPVYYTLPRRVNTARSMILFEAPRSRNGGPTGDYSFALTKYGHVIVGWSDSGRTLRIDPVDRGEAAAAPAKAAFAVWTYIGPAGGAYEFQNLGTYDAAFAGFQTQVTKTFTTALASDAVREKVWIVTDHGNGGSAAREMGPIAWPHSNSAFTVVSPRPQASFTTSVRCQVIYFSGSAWLLLKAYGLVAPPTGISGALCAAVITNGVGYSNNATLTLAGATGTAATFTTPETGDANVGIAMASAGSMTVLPANPASFTGGGGTGLTAFIHYNTGPDAGELTIKDKYPTAFTDSSRLFTDAAGVASATVAAWSQAALLPGGYLGPGGTKDNSLLSVDGWLRVLPGTIADATALGTINWKRNAAGVASSVNLLQVILVDTLGGPLGMRVSRFTEVDPPSADTTDIDLTPAAVIDKRELLLFSRTETATAGAVPSGSSGTPPVGGTLGYQAGYCMVQPYEGDKLYARITAPARAALTAVDVEAVCLPRGVLPS